MLPYNCWSSEVCWQISLHCKLFLNKQEVWKVEWISNNFEYSCIPYALALPIPSWAPGICPTKELLINILAPVSAWPITLSKSAAEKWKTAHKRKTTTREDPIFMKLLWSLDTFTNWIDHRYCTCFYNWNIHFNVWHSASWIFQSNAFKFPTIYTIVIKKFL